jgi:predicted amidophosphoribosyltransferase
MALTICKECRKEISTDAYACPHCGKPQENKSALKKKHITYVLLAVIVLTTILYAVLWLRMR